MQIPQSHKEELKALSNSAQWRFFKDVAIMFMNEIADVRSDFSDVVGRPDLTKLTLARQLAVKQIQSLLDSVDSLKVNDTRKGESYE